MWVALSLVVVVVLALAATLVTAGDDATRDGAPSVPASNAPGVAGEFELRQVLFQETGRIQLRPPLRPGPADGGKHASRDLLRVDCDLKARPMADDDNVVLCDVNGFRYGLGPSALPADPVASATAEVGPSGDPLVAVQLDSSAIDDFATFTSQLSGFGPPLNQAAIVINGVVVAAPAVRDAIDDGRLQITGDFTEDDAAALAASLGE